MRRIALLVTFVSVGCFNPDDPIADSAPSSSSTGSTGSAGSTGSTSEPTTTTDTASTSGTTNPTDPSTTDPTDPSATDASDSAGTTMDTTDPSTTGVDTEGGDICPEFATWLADCSAEYEYETALDDCNANISTTTEISAACGAAYEELLACELTLDCSILESKETPRACQPAMMAFEEACGVDSGTGG